MRKLRLDPDALSVDSFAPQAEAALARGTVQANENMLGFLTGNAMRHIAPILDMTPAEVDDVATYYVMFHKAPVGTYVLQVCRTLSCALNGAERVTEALSETLGIGVGETDASGMFTLQEFECLGACDRAPVVMVNNELWHEVLKPEDCAKFVDDVKARGPASLSGCHLEVEK